jgi:hypothetical protein
VFQCRRRRSRRVTLRLSVSARRDIADCSDLAARGKLHRFNASSQIGRMASAFEHDDLKRATGLTELRISWPVSRGLPTQSPRPPSRARRFSAPPRVLLSLTGANGQDGGRRPRPPGPAAFDRGARLMQTPLSDRGRCWAYPRKSFAPLQRARSPWTSDLVYGTAHPLQRIFRHSTAPRQSGRQ